MFRLKTSKSTSILWNFPQKTYIILNPYSSQTSKLPAQCHLVIQLSSNPEDHANISQIIRPNDKERHVYPRSIRITWKIEDTNSTTKMNKFTTPQCTINSRIIIFIKAEEIKAHKFIKTGLKLKRLLMTKPGTIHSITVRIKQPEEGLTLNSMIGGSLVIKINTITRTEVINKFIELYKSVDYPLRYLANYLKIYQSTLHHWN